MFLFLKYLGSGKLGLLGAEGTDPGKKMASKPTFPKSREQARLSRVLWLCGSYGSLPDRVPGAGSSRLYDPLRAKELL